MMDEIDPGQPFLWVNILGWREIFRDCQESRHPSLLPKLVRTHRTPTPKAFASQALGAKTKPTSDFRTLTSESVPADLASFVLFFQPAHQRLEVIHHCAGGDIFAGGFL